MNNESNKAPLSPLVLVAFFCALASVGIVALAFCLLREISGNDLWAVAAMAAAPWLMGTGMAYFMTRRPRHEIPGHEPR
jgi:hypothetical protein